MSGLDAETFGTIPRDLDGPVFPAPWAARAFALTVALNERGAFAWREWSTVLGREIARLGTASAGDPDVYWQAWLAALEAILIEKRLALSGDLEALRDAWRAAAERTPHGRPIEL